MEKYKLIKEYPGSAEGGSIAKQYDDMWFKIRHHDLISKNAIKSYPEHWAPYKFTTEDGVDIYEEDRSYAVTPDDLEIHYLYWVGNSKNLKYFSTKEAAEAYVESLKLKEFEVGTWYKTNNTFACYNGESSGYGYSTLGYEYWLEDIGMFEPELWEKADMKEVEELLIEETKRRYPVGIKVRSALEGNREFIWEILSNKFRKFDRTDGYFICSDGLIVYNNGEWAEIVNEKKYFGVCPKGSWEIMNDVNEGHTKTSIKWKWFDTKEERDDYVRLKKPQYSEEELIDFGVNLTSPCEALIRFKNWSENNKK